MFADAVVSTHTLLQFGRSKHKIFHLALFFADVVLVGGGVTTQLM